MKVFVYYNLHKKCWSVKALEGDKKGRVIAHLPAITLFNVTFKVSEAGRQRVLREKRKNVHAGVVGNWLGYGVAQFLQKKQRVSYNPYKLPYFYMVEGMKPIHKAMRADLIDKQVYI